MNAIGHNMPPPREAHAMHIEGLLEEATHWLNGDGVNSEADEQGVAKLIEALRQARKGADEQRKAEKAPHDAAAKEVQHAWVPLIARCDTAIGVANDALVPWLTAKKAEQEAAATLAAKEAEEARQKAQAALVHANAGDLCARTTADVLLEEAEIAQRHAARASKAKPQALGGARAIGLRDYKRVELTDPLAFGRWAWTHRQDEYVALLTELAKRERHNLAPIPGIIIHTEQRAA